MLYTFVLDLKLTPEGKVKILEIQDTILSGSTGYEQAYGQCIMKDVVLPFYEKEFGLPFFSVDPRVNGKDKDRPLGTPHLRTLGLFNWHDSREIYKKATALPVNPEFDKNDISTHSAIVAPFYLKGYYSGHVFEEQKEHVTVVNDNRIFIATTENKFLQDRLFTPLIGDLAPVATSVENTTPQDMAEKIKMAITADRIVLKLPEAARAEAVIITDRDKLEDVLRFLTTKPVTHAPRTPDESLSSYFNHQAWKCGQWAKKDIIVAQAFETSVPVVNEQDGKIYDPTMRVFASVWQSGDTVKSTVHGGYWKFPSEPLTTETSSKNIISASPTKKPGGKVAPEHMATVTSQLEAVLPGSFQALEAITPATLIRDSIKKVDAKAMTAAIRYMYLVSHRHLIDTISKKELKKFAESAAEIDIRKNNFLVYNIITKRASLFPGCSEESSAKTHYTNACYADYIAANAHRLPENHSLYKEKKNIAMKKQRGRKNQ